MGASVQQRSTHVLNKTLHTIKKTTEFNQDGSILIISCHQIGASVLGPK